MKRLLILLFLLCTIAETQAQPFYLLGRDTRDKFLSGFWTNNLNASNLVAGINANAEIDFGMGVGGTGTSSYGANRLLFVNAGNTAFSSDPNLTWNGSTLAGVGAFSWDGDITFNGAQTLQTSAGLLTLTGTGGLALNTAANTDLTLGPGTGNVVWTQNSVAAFTSEGSTAVANTLYLKGGFVGIGTSAPAAALDVRGSAVFNEDGADADFRVESDANPSTLFVDGGAFSGAGRIAFGSNNESPSNYFYVDPPNLTATANTAFYRIYVSNNGSISIPASLSANVSAVNIEEPNIILSGGTVTRASTLRIGGAPTEATSNFALDVVSGTSYFGGFVGIGTNGPTTSLFVQANDNATVQTVMINADQASVTASDTFIDFRSQTGSEASIAGTAVAGVIAYNTFTGSHYTQVVGADVPEICQLLEIVEGEITVWAPKTNTVSTLSTATNKVAQVSTNTFKFVTTNLVDAVTVNTNVVTTVYRASPKSQLFLTRVCQTKGVKTAVGVWGGRDKEGRDMVLSIGTGQIWVANKGVNLEIGDLLISSDVLGSAEKQGDDLLRNVTVGKVTEAIVWAPGEVKRLVKCIYLGG